MKLTCNRLSLSKVFDLAASAVKTNSPKEVLQNVKMTIISGRACLMGTDMETGVLTGIDVEHIGHDGAVLLPVPPVRQILRDTEGEQITIEVRDTGTKIISGGADFEIGSANPDEYPTVKAASSECYFELAGSEFERLVRRTHYAVDVNSTRYALGGVQFTFAEDGSVTAIGTDGKRGSLSVAECRIIGDKDQMGEWPVRAICSPGPLNLIAGAVKSCEQIKLSLVGNDVVVESPTCTVTTRQVEGRYPNFMAAIPKTYRDWGSFEFEPAHMLSVIKQASILADRETCGMSFDIRPGTLTLSAKAAMKGASKVEMPILYSGKSVKALIDYQYVAEFLRSLDGQLATMRFNSETEAVVITTEDKSIYVLMPMSDQR